MPETLPKPHWLRAYPQGHVFWLQVMGPGGCPTPHNALAYKLRAPDLAVLDFYATLSMKHKSGIEPRCFS